MGQSHSHQTYFHCHLRSTSDQQTHSVQDIVRTHSYLSHTAPRRSPTRLASPKGRSTDLYTTLIVELPFSEGKMAANSFPNTPAYYQELSWLGWIFWFVRGDALWRGEGLFEICQFGSSRNKMQGAPSTCFLWRMSVKDKGEGSRVVKTFKSLMQVRHSWKEKREGREQN